MSNTSSNGNNIPFGESENPQTFNEFEDPQSQLLTDGKQNAKAIYCACQSLILRANLGTWVERPKDKLKLPEGQILKKSYPETPSLDEEASNQGFWALYDIMAFENIGVSKTIDTGIKYLCCAVCDVGPLGYNDTKSTTNEFLIAVDRVINGSTENSCQTLAEMNQVVQHTYNIKRFWQRS
ncbi:16022_t:CDS:2 [Funneliformis mosseae]|uniref:16022_t:CDS:1 n=1 Tax=Funneliformis mosseae TaxID=27381 RepID=A0A9N8WKM7_FUNMO|nr:16022_t:CDS:2 [Funneliformis mosseae]